MSCDFFVGTPKNDPICRRPTCGKTWVEHVGRIATRSPQPIHLTETITEETPSNEPAVAPEQVAYVFELEQSQLVF